MQVRLSLNSCLVEFDTRSEAGLPWDTKGVIQIKLASLKAAKYVMRIALNAYERLGEAENDLELPKKTVDTLRTQVFFPFPPRTLQLSHSPYSELAGIEQEYS